MLLAGHLTGWRYNLDGYWGAMDFALEAFAASTLLHAGRFTTGQVPGVAMGTLPSNPPPAPADLSPVALADQFLPAQAFTQGCDPIRRDVFVPLARSAWSWVVATTDLMLRDPADDPAHPVHVNDQLGRFLLAADATGEQAIVALISRVAPHGQERVRGLLDAIATAPRWASIDNGQQRVKSLLDSLA